MVMCLQGDHGGLVTSDQEQQKWLDEASTSVKRNAFFMKKALVCVTLMWANSVHRGTSILKMAPAGRGQPTRSSQILSSHVGRASHLTAYPSEVL